MHEVSPSPRSDTSMATNNDRTAAVRQYSLGQILGVWAAAAIPMAVLAWVVAPWLSGRISGPAPFAGALFLCLTVGLTWQFVLVLLLVGREVGSLQWSRLRAALWLLPPRDPKTGRVGGRLWLWALLFIVLNGLLQLVPGIPGPTERDFAAFVRSDGGKAFFSGAWVWFAVVIVYSVLNTALGEELLFRGLLLPRMRGVFGRWDWVANGALFGVYHLHQPWGIARSLVNGVFLLAYPSRRWESAWMGIIVHSAQTVFVVRIVLALVLA